MLIHTDETRRDKTQHSLAQPSTVPEHIANTHWAFTGFFFIASIVVILRLFVVRIFRLCDVCLYAFVVAFNIAFITSIQCLRCSSSTLLLVEHS